DRTHDEVGPVVDRLDADAFGQAACKFRDLVLYPADHGQGVLAEPRNDDPGHDVAFAVQVGDATALVGHQLHPGDVADQHRRAPFGAQHQVLDVLDAAQVAAAPDHVLGLGHFDHAATDVTVALRDHLGDP